MFGGRKWPTRDGAAARRPAEKIAVQARAGATKKTTDQQVAMRSVAAQTSPALFPSG